METHDAAAMSTPGGADDGSVDVGVSRSRLDLDRPLGPTNVAWMRRHNRIVMVLVAHGVVLVGFGLVRGFGVGHMVLELVPIVGLSGAAIWRGLAPRTRSIAASLGLMTAAAEAVHLAGGRSEAHFLYFVLLGVLTLYDDWLPYAAAVLFVLLQHGIMGAIMPETVFSADPIGGSPWIGAAIHGGFILAASAVAWVALLVRNAERAAAEGQRLASEGRFAALVEHGSDLSSIFGLDGRVVYASPAHVSVLGYEPEALLGQHVDDLIHPDDRASVLQIGVRLVTEPEATGTVEFRFAHADGSWRWVEATMANRLDDPGVGGFVCNAHDVTDRVLAGDRLAHDAAHDPLTGLPNRSALARTMIHATSAAARHGQLLAVLYVDVDHFKQVNDTYGHGAGDVLLVAVAHRLTACARAHDTILRIGGDEFVVVATVDDDAAAASLAARMCEAFDEPILLGDELVVVSVSVGLATSSQITDESPLECADSALYAAKAAGRHGWVAYGPERTTGARRPPRPPTGGGNADSVTVQSAGGISTR